MESKAAYKASTVPQSPYPALTALIAGADDDALREAATAEMRRVQARDVKFGQLLDLLLMMVRSAAGNLAGVEAKIRQYEEAPVEQTS